MATFERCLIQQSIWNACYWRDRECLQKPGVVHHRSLLSWCRGEVGKPSTAWASQPQLPHHGAGPTQGVWGKHREPADTLQAAASPPRTQHGERATLVRIGKVQAGSWIAASAFWHWRLDTCVFSCVMIFTAVLFDRHMKWLIKLTRVKIIVTLWPAYRFSYIRSHSPSVFLTGYHSSNHKS